MEKTEKSKTSKGTVYTSKNNKNDTVNTVDKSGSTPGTNLSNKSFHIEKPSEINIERDNKDDSDLYRQVESLSSVTPDQQRITRKNKRKNAR